MASNTDVMVSSTEAPPFSLKVFYGETLTLDALRASGKPVMLLFTDPNCGPCTALLPDFVSCKLFQLLDLSMCEHLPPAAGPASAFC